MSRNKPKNADKKPLFARTWVWVCGSVLLGLFIGFALLWTQRYSLTERYVRNFLKDRGISADFSIKSLSKNRAVIRNIRLSKNGDTFFTSQSITAAYDWQKLINFEIDRLEIKKPVISVEVDESGQITSDWLPESSGGARTPLIFPKDGVFIDAGRVNLASPYGTFTADISAEAVSLTDIKADLSAPEQTFAYQDLSGKIGGQAKITLTETALFVDVNAASKSLNYQDMSAKDLSIVGPVTLQRDTPLTRVKSNLTFNAGQLSSPDIVLQKVFAEWDGTASLPSDTGVLPHASGNWALSAEKAGITNQERRERLAKSATLNETLMNVSATAAFAPGLTSTFDNLMQSSAVKADGHLEVDAEGAKITLSRQAIVTGQSNSISLLPSEGHPFLAYAAAEGTLDLFFGGTLTGPYAATVSSGEFRARQKDGQNLSNIEYFKASLKTHNTWHAKTQSGRPVRLAPLDVGIDYNVQPDASIVRLSGAVDYDGDVPGGYAEGVKAIGLLTLRLAGKSLQATFSPRQNTDIKIASLETQSDWIVKDGAFSLQATGPQYRRINEKGTLRANVEAATGRITHRTEPQEMAFKFQKADTSGVITAARQTWNIKTETTEITSDTFPSRNTRILSPKAAVNVVLARNKPLEFSIDSPETDVKTLLVSASKLAVQAAGQPGNMTVNYGPGRIKFASAQLPVVSLTGDVTYMDGAWNGTAQTFLPGAEETPVNVTYAFVDGIGSADATVENIAFKPRKLQPQQYIPALSGKVSRVDGNVSAKIHVEFGVNTPLKSSGTAVIQNLNVATLPGPVTGLNGELTFSSFFPPQTTGVQTLTIDRFDPGFPLENGVAEFEIIPDGINIESAKWPIGDGFISLDKTSWLYSAPKNRVALRVDDVSLGDFLKDVGDGRLKATGNVSGVLPVVIEGIKVYVDGGLLTVKDGGVIQYTSPQTDAAGESSPYAGYAFDALKNFEYEELEAAISGPLDGPMKLRLLFNGANPDVLYGSEFKFNVGIEGELLNILRSLQSSQNFTGEVIKEIKAQQAKSPTAQTSPSKEP